MTPRLVGHLIGSIRRVWFVPADTAAAATRTPPGAVIEIETKAGHYAHLAISGEPALIRLGTGAAPFPANGRWRRQWLDLTADAAAAFDGRPVITAATPIDPGPDTADGPTAREWRIDLSTGATLWCHRSAGELEFGAARN